MHAFPESVFFLSWYAFLCVNGLENFGKFYLWRNNIYGNDLLDSSVEKLHLVCYTESLLVVFFWSSLSVGVT